MKYFFKKNIQTAWILKSTKNVIVWFIKRGNLTQESVVAY